jgi:hypothetical protein
MTQESPDVVRRIIGTPLSDTEATALIDWYRGVSAAVAAYPEADLRNVEPPLRSMPGPRQP